MNKGIMAFSLLAASTAAQAVNIDLGAASCQITDNDRIYLDSVAVGERAYWIDMQWDSRNNAFRLQDYGASASCPTAAGVWDVSDSDCTGPERPVEQLTFYPSGIIEGINATDGIGSWEQTACEISGWLFGDDFTTRFWGEIAADGTTMAGRFADSDGERGCWSADRVAGPTSVIDPFETITDDTIRD